jgi:hypothetical protein
MPKYVDRIPDIARPWPVCPAYFVTPCGRVFSTKRFVIRELKPAVNVDGYLMLVLRADGRSIGRSAHVLVLETFVGPRPDGMLARHLDGNPANNHVGNLAWGPVQENCRDRDRHYRGTGVLTIDSAKALVRDFGQGMSRRSLAAKYGISRVQVCEVLNGHCWGWVTGIEGVRLPPCHQGESNRNAVLNEDQVREIRALAQQGLSYSAIGKRFGVVKTTVRYIVIGRRWKHVV